MPIVDVFDNFEYIERWFLRAGSGGGLVFLLAVSVFFRRRVRPSVRPCVRVIANPHCRKLLLGRKGRG